MTTGARAVVLLMLMTALACCGKKGAPVAPGPAEEISFPKQYPSR